MSRAPSLEKILVTGGTGFIGRHLLDALCAAGHRPAASARDAKKVEPLPEAIRTQARWLELDLLDHEATRACLLAEKPTVLFHLAGQSARGEDAQAKAACTALNVHATANLLKAAQQAGAERVLLIGSADEYGAGKSGALSEDATLAPVSDYGISKAEATRIAQKMFREDGCPVVILRPFTVYGTHQPRRMFVAEAVECAVSGRPFRMTAGTQKRDLVAVADVTRALMAAASLPHLEGQGINLGSGQPESLSDVAKLIWELSESDAPLLIGARAASAAETHDTWADISRARELLNWEPRISLEDGLREMIECEREQQMMVN